MDVLMELANYPSLILYFKIFGADRDEMSNLPK